MYGPVAHAKRNFCFKRKKMSVLNEDKSCVNWFAGTYDKGVTANDILAN